jgi:uncharacterized protein (TIGR02001 family)
MKKLLTLLLAFSVMPAFAGMDGFVGYTSDYMWRGQTQTQGGGAFQAGVDLDYEGFFVGVWGSEVDFGNDSASFEYDLYGGYNFQVSDKLSMSVGVMQYRWDDNDIEMVEEAFIKIKSPLLDFGYSVDTDNSDKDYMQAGLNVPFVKVVDVQFVYGRFFDDSNWKGLNLSKSWDKIDLGLMIMEGAKDGQFADSVSLTLNYNL